MNKSTKTAQLDAEARKLLGDIIKEGVLEFKPTLNRDGIHYVEIERNMRDADPVRVETMLQSLEKHGFLESKIVDRALKCPDCGSPQVYSKYVCPKCDSYNVEYTELIEHAKCGYIGSRDRFIKGSSLVCPGCQAELVEDANEHDVAGKYDVQTGVTVYADVKYLVIGSCYQCEKCGYSFDKPGVIHSCQKCGRIFTYRDAKYVKILAYKVTDEIANDFRRELPVVENIEKILTEKGFKVQLHPEVSGASGVQHSFDVLAEKDGTRLVIDVSITGDKNDMISLLGKKVDVNPTKAVIIDLSDLDELSPLGKVYDIDVFKAASNQNLLSDFKNLVASLDLKPKETS